MADDLLEPVDAAPRAGARRARTTEIGISFDPRGLAEGWAFGVGTWFRLALDIIQTERVEKDKAGRRRKVLRWTRGVPPVIAFDVGDHFLAPPQPPGDSATRLAGATHELQVVAARPDVLVNGRIVPGEVTVVVRRVEGGRYVGEETRVLSQGGFALMLQRGSAADLRDV